jgi:hypothetical protein
MHEPTFAEALAQFVYWLQQFAIDGRRYADPVIDEFGGRTRTIPSATDRAQLAEDVLDHLTVDLEHLLHFYDRAREAAGLKPRYSVLFAYQTALEHVQSRVKALLEPEIADWEDPLRSKRRGLGDPGGPPMPPSQAIQRAPCFEAIEALMDWSEQLAAAMRKHLPEAEDALTGQRVMLWTEKDPCERTIERNLLYVRRPLEELLRAYDRACEAIGRPCRYRLHFDYWAVPEEVRGKIVQILATATKERADGEQ